MNFQVDSDQCSETNITEMDMIQPTQVETNSCGGSKRKKSQTATKQPQKKSTTAKHDALLQSPMTKLHEFCLKSLKKDMTDSENVLSLIEGLFQIEDGKYPVQSVLILIGLVCMNHWETLVHPRMWTAETMQTYWKEHLEWFIPTTTYLNLLTHLRKSLKTDYKSMPVHCIVDLYLDNTDTSASSLCRMDVLELKTVLEKLCVWLNGTPLNTGGSSHLTKTISTFPTSAPTTTTVVDAFGYEEAHQSRLSDDVDFAGLLEHTSCSRQTMQVSCDTYLQVLDSSRELVATPKMNDYVIDINIYRQVLKSYLIKQRSFFINENTYRMANTYNVHINLKKNIPYLQYPIEQNDYFNKIWGSLFQKNVMSVIPFLSRFSSYNVCRRILELYDDYILDDNLFFMCLNNTTYKSYIMNDNNNSKCSKCTFSHNEVEDIKNWYPLLSSDDVIDVIKKCIL